MESILKLKDISKSYFSKKVLNNVSFEIPKGRIVGLLGPNGSGKTTLIKLATGLLKPSSGEIYVCGEEVGIKTKAYVSYMPDRNHLYKWMTIKGSINYFKDFFLDFDEDKALAMMDFMKLNVDDKVGELSKGMLEKLLLTLALSRKAKLFILDEPLGGVDPVAREKILNAIIQNFNQDSSMLITTHLVNDVERLFDDVIFIKEGEKVLSGSAEDLRNEKGKSIDELYREVFE